MVTRRTALFLPLALGAQSSRPAVIWVWLRSGELPAEVYGSSVIFPRCYVASSRPSRNRRAIETGKFPNAITSGDPSLRMLLEGAGYVYSEAADAARGNAITVFTQEGGQDNRWEEKSIRVPLAIRYPGSLRPRIAGDVLISHADLTPTIAGLLGIEAEGMQGRNLGPLLLEKPGVQLPDSVFIQGETWRAVIRGYDKLITDPSASVEHFFNLAADKQEETDLVGDPASRLNRDGVLALLQLWMRRVGDGLDPSGLRRR